MSAALETAVDHHRRGDLARAETLYRRILKKAPNHPDALHLLGCIELSHRNRAEAVRLIRKAIETVPTVPLYHQNLAEALHRDGRPEEAEAESLLAIRLGGDRIRSLNLLGVLALERLDYETARAHLAAALELAPVNAETLLNLGTVLNRLGIFSVAKDCCQVATEAEPGNALAWNNLGMAWRGMGRLAEAKEAFLRAGDLPLARFNLGYVHLLEGRLHEGFVLSETRRLLHDPGRGLHGREWQGGSEGRHLLVVHEQGMGDTILTSRFFPMLLDRFEEVTVLVQAPLQRLVAAIDPRLKVVTSVEGVRYDRWCPTMSLPLRFGIDSREKIPLEPWMRVATRPEARESLRVPAGGRLLRAGLNWAGNPSFLYDRVRSTTLDTMRPLLEVPGVEWVSLHKGYREQEAESAGLPAPLRDAADFADTAEVLAGLDLVVSTETAIPNLSAAMGVKTLVLGAMDYDWRWRGWYRDVTVCAQDEPGDWGSAVGKAVAIVRGLGEARPNA